MDHSCFIHYLENPFGNVRGAPIKGQCPVCWHGEQTACICLSVSSETKEATHIQSKIIAAKRWKRFLQDERFKRGAASVAHILLSINNVTTQYVSYVCLSSSNVLALALLTLAELIGCFLAKLLLLGGTQSSRCGFFQPFNLRLRLICKSSPKFRCIVFV